jgi:RNA polymerase sigma-70 factor (ECF subfamily)
MAEAAQTAGAFEEGRVGSEAQIAAEFYFRTCAEKYGMPPADFGQILCTIARKHLPEGCTLPEVRDFCAALRLDELVLARACVAGNEKAWEDFLIRYREKLYDMALRIARESSAARDLADSLYADLYGLTSRDTVRVSKLASYNGRGSLEGWLRTVLAQEFVNRYRKNKRFVSLDETDQDEDGQEHRRVQELVAPERDQGVKPDARLTAATDDALAALSPDERFILAAYHLDGRTLAEIANILQVHESTISRKLEKITGSLRRSILNRLTQHGMSRRQAEEALEIDVRDIQLDLRRRLQDSGAGAFSKGKARESDGSG